MATPPTPVIRRTPKPVKLGPRGRRFWAQTTSEFVLSNAELEILAEACRCLDQLDQLRKAVEADGYMITGSMGQRVVHPALARIDGTRSLLARLLAALELPDEYGLRIPSPEQTRAKQAAAERWRDHTQSNIRRLPRGSA